MKKFLKVIGLAAFLTAGIWPLAAQDLIILRDGNITEARVLEISPTEIRYRRYGFLDGPIFVIPVANVLSIRFESGATEVFAPPPVTGQQHPHVPGQRQPQAGTAIDPGRFIFGTSANLGGFLVYGLDTGGAGGFRIELGRGNFNSEINLGFNDFGFSGLVIFNYFWHSRIGGFYLGGGLGLTSFGYWYEVWDSWGGHHHWGEFRTVLAFQWGLNIGYKFVTRTGIFFRTGAFLGAATARVDDGFESFRRYWFVFNPDISIGWTMR